LVPAAALAEMRKFSGARKPTASEEEPAITSCDQLHALSYTMACQAHQVMTDKTQEQCLGWSRFTWPAKGVKSMPNLHH